MTKARIIRIEKPYPDGSGTAAWFEIESIHGSVTHRSRERSYTSADDARRHAEAQGFDVEPGVTEDW